ncbi:CDP-diacylglycerol--glycerol-3-phosphate 3-phosphatidyltransferase [Bacilli bacterium PM5-3]|nr:CDP-diacylglycerol--glycerol-3-phosphate 3-phosphatidyltransferase [Bacilli bacterium PM5-3]MDH6603811.1 CDP-diacylglycerol--glycerol-3-phosphate 3-phosphatidyltransferase [Bacilli bacterium PM5-9]
MKINTATKITIFRIFLIPLILVILLFPYHDYEINTTINLFGIEMYLPYFASLIVFAIASLSDALDGYIARSTNTITNLGKFLDPVADKLLVDSVLIYLVSSNHLPVILVIIMISRDIMVDTLRLLCVENNVVVAASIYGKLKTVFQMVMICLILLFALPNVELAKPLTYLAYLTTLLSVVSGIDYFIKNINLLKK